MKDNQFLRFAIMMSNGQAQTFKRNLSKLIKLVLFDADESLTILQIINAISSNYSLSFSDIEIKSVIDGFKNEVEVEKDVNGRENDKFRLSIEETDKVKKYFENNKLDNIINKYISIKEEIEVPEKEQIGELIQRYIYYVFNKDVKTLASLFDTQTKGFLREEESDFTKDEIIIINDFLSWEDQEKNTVIYELVSSGFEYCMLTVKKDNSSYKDVFRGKTFYLDANIIFRLAGINNLYRKEIIEAFVNKCRENNITLKYTNFTQGEIDKTIEYQVSNIKKWLKGQEPLKSDYFALMLRSSENMDFYDLYYQWSKKGNTNYKDYQSFERYLKLQVNSSLNNIVFESHEKYASSDHIKSRIFTQTVEDLNKYKTAKKFSKPQIQSVKVDVENFLLVEGKNKRSKITKNTFFEKKYYLITADHYLIDWAESRMPGVVPTVVLPSVWYSLMLKYSGRTEDDYKAFTQFLKLPVSDYDENAEIKQNILAHVLSLDETASIKEELIFNINEDLKNQTEILNVEEYVDKEYDSLTNKKVNEALLSERQSLDKEKESIKTESFSSGKEEGKTETYTKMAERVAHRNKKIREIFFAMFCFSTFVLLLMFLYVIGVLSNEVIENFLEKNNIKIEIASLLLPSLVSALSYCIPRMNLLPIDEKYIAGKIRKKCEK